MVWLRRMSLVHHGLRMLSVALALALVAACSDDDPDSNGAGSGAGTSSSGGSGGGSGAGSGGAGSSGASAGAGGTSTGGGGFGGSGGTSAGMGGMTAGTGAGAIGGGSAEGGAGGMSAGTGGSDQDAGPLDDECVVATRLDDCCPRWYTMSRDEALSDPCALAIGEPAPSGDEANGCAPQVCTDVLCQELGDPPSRVARPGPSGECIYADECNAEASCVIAMDITRCCPCYTSMPKELVDREPCLVEATMSARPAQCTFPQACALVDCAECPEQPAEPSCLVRDSTSLCQ